MRDTRAGIYMVKNRKDRKVYIGSTGNFHKRKLEHFATLRKGTHQNKKLQQGYDKSGKNAFTFEILEVWNDEDTLKQRELFWMNQFDSMNFEFGYNSCPSALGGNANNIFRQKVEGERNGRVILKAVDIPTICARLNMGESSSQISKTYGVRYQVISSIKDGKRWRDLAEIYLNDEILSTWKTPPLPKGIHPDSISEEILKAICAQINKGIADKKIGNTYGLSETGVGVIRKGGCRSSETINLLNDDVLELWPYNIHLVAHLEPPKKVRKSLSKGQYSNGNQKVTNNQVIEICNMLNNGIPTKEIAQKFNLSTTSISYIKNGKNHRKISKIHLKDSLRANWKYKQEGYTS